MQDHRSLNIAATIMLVVAALGLLVVALVAGFHSPSVAAQILLHCFEGALVGGLCDWFAVAKTYRAVEVNRDAVADGIGSWVSGELLSHQVLQDTVRGALSSKETRLALYDTVDKWLGSRADIERRVAHAWSALEPRATNFIVGWKFAGRGDDFLGAAATDEELLRVARLCAAGFVESLAKDEAWRRDATALVKAAAPGITSWFVGESQVVGYLDRASKALRVVEAPATPTPVKTDGKPDGKPSLRSLATAAVGMWCKTWDSLEESDRRRGAKALLDVLAAPLQARLVLEADRLRDELRRAVTLDQVTAFREVAVAASALLSDGLSVRAGHTVTTALKSKPAREFRLQLERTTRRYLEMIRINGTILGFGAGGAIAALGALT